MNAAFPAYARWVKRDPGAALVLILCLLWVLMVGGAMHWYGGKATPNPRNAFEDAMVRAHHERDLTAPAGAR